jgi:hypothetical protein
MTTKVCPWLWREVCPALYGYFVGKYGRLMTWEGASFAPDKQDRKAMKTLWFEANVSKMDDRSKANE